MLTSSLVSLRCRESLILEDSEGWYRRCPNSVEALSIALLPPPDFSIFVKKYSYRCISYMYILGEKETGKERLKRTRRYRSRVYGG